MNWLRRIIRRRTYLDYAAGVSGNPSSPHAEGRRSREQLEGARATIARLIEAQASDVIFTSGATEANALAILGVARAAGAPAARHVLYLPSAHASIVENVKLLAEEGAEIEALPIKEYRVDTEALAKMLRPETVLVTMEAVCGETGVVWNTRAVAEQLHASRGLGEGRALLHVDASQAPLTEKITRAHFGADLVTFDGAKVGPRGIGTLVASRNVPLVPLYRGGGQERGLRSGSEAPALARQFAEALRSAAAKREAFRARAESAREDLIATVASIPGVLVNGAPADRQAPNILNFSLLERDTDYLVAILDEAGFAVSTRSACETDSEEGSRAVFALTGDTARASATLRISWGSQTHSHDLRHFARALQSAIAFIDNNSAR